MNDSIFSLAYLQYTYEVLKMDILDPYVPMFCNCLLQEDVNIVDIKNLKCSMSSIYGIKNLTYGAVQSICERMASNKYGILKKINGGYHVIKEKLNGYHVKLTKNDKIIEEFNFLIKCIADFSSKFEKTYSPEEIEKGLLHFIDLHGVDLLVGQGKKVFDSILRNEDKRLSYIISRYVITDKENGGNAVEILNRLAKGNVISNLVSLSGRHYYTGSLKDVTVIIDTPFFYNLLGANNDSNKETAIEIMSILQRNGAHFSMFQHNLNEVYAALDDAIHRIITKEYDIRKSSRLLKMAVAEGYTSMQLESMRASVETIRNKWNIKDEVIPTCPTGYNDIDVELLTEIIDSAYTNNHLRSLFYNEKNMLSKDVDSITYTYRIRGHSPIQSLKGCKAIMLTTNRIIATTSNDERINTNKHKIPVCATDIFLSSILWSNYPGENDNLNKKLLISECYNNIQLDDALVIRFFEDLKAKKVNEDISESQYLIMTTSRLAMNLLGDKTQNDINAYTDRTSIEILNIIEQEHQDELEKMRLEGEKKLYEEKQRSQQEIERVIINSEAKLAEKESQLNIQSQTINTTEKTCAKISQFITFTIMIVISLLLLTGFFAKRYMPSSFWKSHPCVAWIWYGFDVILSIWAFLNWIGVIWKYVDLKTYIYQKVYTYLKYKFMGN